MSEPLITTDLTYDTPTCQVRRGEEVIATMEKTEEGYHGVPTRAVTSVEIAAMVAVGAHLLQGTPIPNPIQVAP
jgi:hypothetical protein